MPSYGSGRRVGCDMQSDVADDFQPTLALQSKEEIASDVKEGLTKAMGSFGFTIIQTLVLELRHQLIHGHVLSFGMDCL